MEQNTKIYKVTLTAVEEKKLYLNGLLAAYYDLCKMNKNQKGFYNSGLYRSYLCLRKQIDELSVCHENDELLCVRLTQVYDEYLDSYMKYCDKHMAVKSLEMQNCEEERVKQ